ncbi:cyanophycin synthetase family protein [Massilia putida]|uniref:cyanophycin synthetase family protein n=1 Tax=Massilia putida TaxID=1141883 RepID=UPI000953505E|nr:Mur ligase family protein [Massilia putida]
MQILEQRFLRGPNIHAATPCLLSVLDLDDLYGVSTRDLPQFNDALLALLPSLADYLVPTGQPGGFAQRLREGTYLARVIEHVTLGLQCLAGAPAAFGRTRPVTGKPGQFRIVCAYQLEKVAQPAFSLAVDIVDALAHGRPFDLAPRLAELRGLAEHYAIGTSTAAVLAAAQERGIPVMRIAEDANLFQLGWGVKQKRIQDTITGDTGTIAVRIAGDKQLTRQLLSEAGVPVPKGDIDGLDYRVLVAGGKVAAASLRRPADAGGDAAAEDVTDLLPESTRRLCVRAAAKIGLDVAGIDIVCRDIAVPLADQGGAVIGVDASPGIGMHLHPGSGAPRDAGDAIVTSLMGDSDGRIPVIACTGTNGKTTTTLLMAHTVRLTGRVTGVTSTHGVTIGGKEVTKGDCTGYWSARTVLSSPDVEFAVLETARGGILKRGLAFDRCDIGMVLNVSPDHLGLDGVDTIEDLAQVKAVVPLAATRAVVLNAEDPLCVAMARRVHPDVEIVYFAMEADNPVLLRHLEEGGRAVYFQDNSIVVADATYHQELLRVEAMPIAFGGRARYNIANGLAATAGLMAAGLSNLQIATGLSTFVSDGKTNPLRTNVFDVRGVTVIVDYAHNPAAYAALAEMARALLPGQLVGIVTAPGDRRDADLLDVGRVCAGRFDELVVYESSSRGRTYGGAVDLILRGAEDVVGKTDTLHREPDVGAAIRLGLSLCRRGDVLVFACGSSLDVFVEAIRQTDPESAARIAAQAG